LRRMCSSGASILSTNGLMKQPASQLGGQATPTKSLVITRTDAFFNLHLSDCVLSRIIRSAVQTNGRACHQQSDNEDGTAEGATPETAQAQELLAQANLERVGSANHRRGTQRKL
jgi:hypothetical protein